MSLVGLLLDDEQLDEDSPCEQHPALCLATGWTQIPAQAWSPSVGMRCFEPPSSPEGGHGALGQQSRGEKLLSWWPSPALFRSVLPAEYPASNSAKAQSANKKPSRR